MRRAVVRKADRLVKVQADRQRLSRADIHPAGAALLRPAVHAEIYAFDRRRASVTEGDEHVLGIRSAAGADALGIGHRRLLELQKRIEGLRIIQHGIRVVQLRIVAEAGIFAGHARRAAVDVAHPGVAEEELHRLKRQHVLRPESAALVRMHTVVERCRQVGGEVLPGEGNAVQRARAPCRAVPLVVEASAIDARVIIRHARGIVRTRVLAAGKKTDTVVIRGIFAAFLAVVQFEFLIEARIIARVRIEDRCLGCGAAVFRHGGRGGRRNCSQRDKPRKHAQHQKCRKQPSCVSSHKCLQKTCGAV